MIIEENYIILIHKRLNKKKIQNALWAYKVDYRLKHSGLRESEIMSDLLVSTCIWMSFF